MRYGTNTGPEPRKGKSIDTMPSALETIVDMTGQRETVPLYRLLAPFFVGDILPDEPFPSVLAPMEGAVAKIGADLHMGYEVMRKYDWYLDLSNYSFQVEPSRHIDCDHLLFREPFEMGHVRRLRSEKIVM